MKRLTYILAALLLIFPVYVTIAEDANDIIAGEAKLHEKDKNFMEASSYSDDEFKLTDENTYTIEDPFEDFNRGMFAIHKGLDTVVFKPVAHVYRGVVPKVGRDRVDSVLSNMREPVNILNSVLQGNGDKLANSTGRFLVNTIFGLGGLFDVASEAGIEQVNEDFGKTMAHYGIDTGPYIFIPVLGPSSGRDVVGKAADVFSDPFVYTFHKDTVYVIGGVRYENTRESLLDATDNIEKTSIDEYATIRSIYAQKRKDLKND